MATERRTKTQRVQIHLDDTPSTALRVLLLSVSGELGGAELSLAEVVAAIPPERIELHACVPHDSPLSRVLQTSGVRVHELSLRRFRRTIHPVLMAGQLRAMHRSAREISEICSELKIDLVHGNTNAAALLAWEVTRQSQVPHVWHCRDMMPMHGMARILGRSAVGVVAISRAVETYLLQGRVPTSKIHRIDNGIDLRRIPEPKKWAEVRTRVRSELGIEAQRPVVLSVGAYVPWKKHEDFFAALSAIRSVVPGTVGLLAGSDQAGENAAYEELLREQARKLALGPSALKVLHQREDVPELMCAADVLASCSENEPFGRVLAEAGAAGLPVVSTNSGAKSEIVDDHVTGLLTAPGDVGAMASACATLLRDRELRAEMGRAARERVERLYDVRRTANELTMLFEQLVQKSGSLEI
ncbi:MAG TPA: glycosyltransferase family 4 protein [Planctomycetota bacterium]